MKKSKQIYLALSTAFIMMAAPGLAGEQIIKAPECKQENEISKTKLHFEYLFSENATNRLYKKMENEKDGSFGFGGILYKKINKEDMKEGGNYGVQVIQTFDRNNDGKPDLIRVEETPYGRISIKYDKDSSWIVEGKIVLLYADENFNQYFDTIFLDDEGLEGRIGADGKFEAKRIYPKDNKVTSKGIIDFHSADSETNHID